MDKLASIINDTKNNLLKIILLWGEIAGNNNREIMLPYDLKNKTLFIAVPNGMVSKTAIRFKENIIANINEKLKKKTVEEIKFILDINRFKEQGKKEQINIRKKPVQKEKIKKRTQELNKMGIDSPLSSIMAEIELLWQRNNDD